MRGSIVALLALLSTAPACAQEPPHGLTDLEAITIAGVQYNLVTFRDPNAANRWFDADLEPFHIPGFIVSCRLLIDLPGSANHSYGGYCNLRDNNLEMPVEVCRDVVAGHFRLMPTEWQPEDKAKLAAFVAAGCHGG